MEFLQHLTDDQTALIGCVGALLAAIGLLSASFHANPQNKQQQIPVRQEEERETSRRRAA